MSLFIYVLPIEEKRLVIFEQNKIVGNVSGKSKSFLLRVESISSETTGIVPVTLLTGSCDKIKTEVDPGKIFHYEYSRDQIQERIPVAHSLDERLFF